MTRLTMVLIVIACLTTPTVYAQSKYTGQDWRHWDDNVKSMYLVGWVDGKANATWETMRALEPKLANKGMTALDDPRLKDVQRTVTVGQLMIGLDEFFKDYRNINIQVRTGVSLVRDQITGVRELTEEWLQKIRKIEAEKRAKEPN